MIRARHVKLTQDSNQRLLDIRQNEINYYSDFLITFSTLAALCASLIVNTVTQVQAYSTVGLLRGLKSWFWLSCTVTICFGIHCVVVSSVTLVYGLGLALKGPLGSMIRALKGMVRASKIVYTTFLITMVGFVIVNMATFWMVAFTEIALATTFIFIVFVIGIAYHCVEITERFYWKELDQNGTDVDNDLIERANSTAGPDRSSDLDTPNPAMGRNKGKKLNIKPDKKDAYGSETREYDLQEPLVTNDHLAQDHHKVVHDHRSKGQRQGHERWEGNATDKNDEDLHLDADEDVYYEGSLSVKSAGGSLLSFGTRSYHWDRYYVVLSRHYMWFYSDKEAYDRLPEEPVKTRPIDISEFDVVPVKDSKTYFNLEAKASNEVVGTEEDDADAGSLKLKNWELRSDTSAEKVEWLRVLALATAKTQKRR